MKRFPHIYSKLFYSPLLITRQKHSAICRVLDSKLRSDASMLDTEPGDLSTPNEPEVRRVDSTCVIPIHGILGKHLEPLEMISGGCDLDCATEMLNGAEADPSVDRIIFDFRTPGGGVTGIPEFARRIANCRKDTVAFTDSECCSGGVWLATQCKQFFCTESAQVGSIGVWCAYEDCSRALENAGVNTQEISAGKFKTTGAYWKPLSKEEAAMLQAQVDKTYAQFKDAVGLYREVSDENMQGQVFDGIEAVQIGLVDGLVEDMDDLFDDPQQDEDE